MQHRSRPRKHRAYTLLELTIVLVVMGILAALAVATYASVIGNSRTQVADASALEISHSAVTIAAQTQKPASPSTVNTSLSDIHGVVLSAYTQSSSDLLLLYAVSSSNNVTTNVCVDIPEVVDATPSLCPLPSAVPGAPTALIATANGSSASLSWTAPTTGGNLITSYVVQYSSNGGSTWTPAANSISSTSTTTSSLPTGTYVFKVAAINTAGQGVYSSSSSSISIVNTNNISTPSPSVNINTASGSTASMSWTWAVPTGGSGSLTYTWSLSPAVSGCSTATTSATSVSCANDLTPSTSYTFSLYATDSAADTSSTGSITATSATATTTTTTTLPPTTTTSTTTSTTTLPPTTTTSTTTSTTLPPTTTTTDPPLATPNPVVTENVTSGGTGTMAWDWTAVTGGTGTITYYWSLSPSATGCFSGSATALSVTCTNALTPATTYVFSLYAQDSEGSTSSVGSISAEQMSTTTTTAPAPTTTTTLPNPSPVYPLYLLSTGAGSCKPVLTMSGAAVVQSQGGLAPIGVSSPCASSIALSGSAALDASSIETADTALTSYCFSYSPGGTCVTSLPGPTEYYHTATADPFSSLTAPLNPGTQSAVSCNPVWGSPVTCPAGQYATSPTLTSTAAYGVTFASGTTVFTQPVTITNNAVVVFSGGTVWFKGGVSIIGDGSVVFDTGTYIFGNSMSDTCPSLTCFTTSNSGSVSTASGGALFFIEAGSATLDGDSTTSLQGEAAYDEIALWDAAASGTTNPITIANSGSIAASFGGIYAPSGEVVLTGAGQSNALFVETSTATLSNSGTLSIGSS